MMTNLIGAWEFVQSTAKDIAGNELADPMNDAKGILIYTDTEYMSVQLYIPNKNYIAYYGYYKFDLTESIVTHQIKGTTSPALTNRSVERKVRFYHKDHISLINTLPEKVDMEIPIYRELCWRRIQTSDE